MDSVNMDVSGINQSSNQDQSDGKSDTSPESIENNTGESGKDKATASPDNSSVDSAGDDSGSGPESATSGEEDNTSGIESESEGEKDGSHNDTGDAQSAENNDDEGQNASPSPRPESTDQPNRSESPQSGDAERSSSDPEPERNKNTDTDSASSDSTSDTETSEDQHLESGDSPPANSESASNEDTSPSTADPDDSERALEETQESNSQDYSNSQDHSNNYSEAAEDTDTNEYEDIETENTQAQAADAEPRSEVDDTDASSENPNEESHFEPEQSGTADNPDNETIAEHEKEFEQGQVTGAGVDESVEQKPEIAEDISGDSSTDTSGRPDTEGPPGADTKPDNAPTTDGKGTGGGEIDLFGSEGSEEVSSTTEDRDKSESTETDLNSDTWTDDIDSDPEIDEDLLSEYESRADRQERHQEEINAQIEQELESLQETLDQIDDISVRELEVVDGSGIGSYRSSETTEIKRNATRLARILERRLNKEERSDFRNDRRQGKIDTRVVHRLKFQDFRVFKEESSPDDKDYDVVFVLDRSGSMTSDMQAAENATATLLLALEEIDIDTCLIDVYRNKPRVAKPFGVDVEAKLDSILTDVNSGGTPLTPCLELAREHLRKRKRYPFMIVITDGRPSNKSAYKKELKRTNFPVLGVYLDFTANSVDDVPNSVRDSGELFDRKKIITDKDDLASSLRQLCEGVMF
jgi:Mg-chelatase subunit ChlD